MSNIGDIVEQDGILVKIIDLQSQTYDDGTVVTITNTEPVVQLSE